MCARHWARGSAANRHKMDRGIDSMIPKGPVKVGGSVSACIHHDPKPPPPWCWHKTPISPQHKHIHNTYNAYVTNHTHKHTTHKHTHIQPHKYTTKPTHKHTSTQKYGTTNAHTCIHTTRHTHAETNTTHGTRKIPHLHHTQAHTKAHTRAQAYTYKHSHASVNVCVGGEEGNRRSLWNDVLNSGSGPGPTSKSLSHHPAGAGSNLKVTIARAGVFRGCPGVPMRRPRWGRGGHILQSSIDALNR